MRALVESHSCLPDLQATSVVTVMGVLASSLSYAMLARIWRLHCVAMVLAPSPSLLMILAVATNGIMSLDDQTGIPDSDILVSWASESEF